MDNTHENGNFDLFKYQLEDANKILILYILREFPQEIKDQICDAIDLAIDKYLLEIEQYEEDFYIGEPPVCETTEN